MSTNCIKCVTNRRTGNDLLCDECRTAEPIIEARHIWGREGGTALMIRRHKTGAIELVIARNEEVAASITLENYRVRNILLPQCQAAADSLTSAEGVAMGGAECPDCGAEYPPLKDDVAVLGKNGITVRDVASALEGADASDLRRICRHAKEAHNG